MVVVSYSSVKVGLGCEQKSERFASEQSERVHGWAGERGDWFWFQKRFFSGKV